MKRCAFFLALVTALAASDSADWVARSNRNAEVLLKNRARFVPEAAGKDGVSGVDEQIIDLKPNLWERQMDAERTAGKTLEERLQSEKDPLVRQDLEILIGVVREGTHGLELRRKYYIPYVNALQTIYSGI